MKRIMSFILAGFFLVFSAGLLWAATTFTITAVVPIATGVNITPFSVVGTTFTKIDGTALSFGTMTFDPDFKIWRAPNFFAIDVANAGPGSPNVTVDYAEGKKPVNQVKGLGYKGTADFKKVVFVDANTNTETAITGHARKALKDVSSENIPPAKTVGGWLRVYVGLADGTLDTPGEPFTNADQSGTYTGTLTITATVS